MNAVARFEIGLERAFSAPRLRWWTAAGTALFVLAALCFRLGDAPVTRSAEQRCYEVASHMVESGTWLVPVMDGKPRLKKPPLYYWAASAAGALAGGESRLALRVPAALAALGLLVSVFLWGRSLGGFANGALAALCLLMMFQFWTLGRRGVAEMPLALFSTLALFAFERIYWGRRRALLPAFFGALFLAFLTKATVALLLVGLPIAVRLSLDRAWRQTLRWDLLAGAVVCVLGCLGWYVAVLLWVPGAPAVLRESLLLPLGLTTATEGSAAHVRSLWFFVPQLLGAAAPAIVLAPLVPWQLRRRRGHPDRPRESFPALGFGSLFLAFSLFPMKQKHYLTPLLPLLALSLAPALRAAREECRDLFALCVRYLGGLVLVAALPLALVLALHLEIAGESKGAIALVSALVPAAATLGFLASRQGCLRCFGLAAVTLTLVGLGIYHGSFLPLREGFHKDLVQDIPRFDAQRWTRTFERHPALRAIYRARHWEPPSAAG